MLAGDRVEGPETPVTMGLQRAHSHFLSQDENLAVVRFGLLDVWRMTAHGDIAKQAEGMRLVAMS